MLIWGSFVKVNMQQQQGNKTELGFKDLVISSGCSSRAADELWKWYDNSTMKGGASF
jgi:hypothetical protein